MRHRREEELIAYREGVAERRAVIADHLSACEKCRAEMERIEAVLAALDTLPVPEPGADYGRQVWKEIAPRLTEKPGRGWHVWMDPRRLAAASVIVALILAAFVAGRITRPGKTVDNIASQEQVRRFAAREPGGSADSAGRGRCGPCRGAGRTGARAAGCRSQPGRGHAGAARSDSEKDRGTRDFVQSPGGQQGTATTPGGHEAC